MTVFWVSALSSRLWQQGPGSSNLLSLASPGTKGLECSPSTPTMNSYFYKFMINLLKRFSSERKLLETRGAFIIRSEHPSSLTETPEHPWDGWDRDGSVKQPKYYIQSEPKPFPQSSLALQQTVLEQMGFAFHMSRHHISLSHPWRQSGSLLNSVVRACFVKKQLDQPEHKDRALRVPS